MKKITHLVKVSGISSGSGVIGCLSGQYIGTIQDLWLKLLAMFVMMTVLGVASKFVIDKVAPKP
jgi:hypothetical protein